MLAEDLERIRASSRRRKKTRWRSIMSSANWPKSIARSGSRLSVARLELERLTREDQRARDAARRESQAWSGKKEQARFDQEKALEESRAEFESCRRTRTRIGEEHSALRADLAGLEERARSERARRHG